MRMITTLLSERNVDANKYMVLFSSETNDKVPLTPPFVLLLNGGLAAICYEGRSGRFTRQGHECHKMRMQVEEVRVGWCSRLQRSRQIRGQT